MEIIAWDTSVYITKFRNGFSWDDKTFQELVLNSVVISELSTGFAERTNDLIIFKNYVSSMVLNNRVVTPSFNDWYNAGTIIGKIIHKRPDLKNKKALLSNDCLIALSSKRINAKVITSNIKDFELLREYINFQVSYQSC